MNTSDAKRAPAPRHRVRVLLLRLVLACLLPGLIGSIALFSYLYGIGLADLEKDTLHTVRALVQVVDAHLAQLHTAAVVLAESPSLQSGDLAGFYRLASDTLHAPDLLDSATAGSNVVLSDPDGQQVLNTLLPFGSDLPMSRNREQMQALFATGRPFVTDVFTSRITGAPTLAVYVPVKSAGKVMYALGIGIFPAQLNRILNDQHLPPGWVVAILDRTGTVAARNLAPERFVGAKAVAPLVAAAASAAEGSITADTLEGIPTRTYFSRSERTGWSVAIGIPREGLLAPLVRSAAWFGLGIAALFAVGSYLALVLGGRIAASVRAVIGMAHALEQGRPLTSPTVHFQEAAEVGQALSHAEQVLQQRGQLLEQARRRLEISDARLRGIFDSAIDAILTADQNQRIVMANPAAAAMFRVPGDGLIGMRLDQLMPARYREQHYRDVSAFGQAESPARHMGRSRDVVALRADGLEFPVDASISQLHSNGQRLFTVILRDISERRRAETALQNSEEALRRMVVAQDTAQEDERKRIARELHDDLQQALGAIKVKVATIGAELAGAPTTVSGLLHETEALAGAAITSTRRIVNDLRPQILEDLGLPDALVVLVHRFNELNDMDCDLEIQGGPGVELACAPAVAFCLYRVTQEALNNIVKHAQARVVQIRLGQTPEGRVVLRIADDGCGMHEEDRDKPGSFGLVGMLERLRAVGGQLRVHSAPGQGTTIEATVLSEGVV